MFYLHNPNQLYKNKPITLNSEVISHFSPDNFSIMEFRSDRDYQLCRKIKGKHQLLGETEYKLRAKFHMTNDSNLFSSKNKLGNLPLYEGKMIHQYNSNFGLPRYFLNEEQTKTTLMRKELLRIKKLCKTNNFEHLFSENNFLLDYQTYRLVHRKIGRSTDELTLISTVIPKNVFASESNTHVINCSYSNLKNELKQKVIPSSDLITLMALLNSLVLNYYIRNKISANLNMFYLYELPIPKANKKQTQQIVEKAFTLLYAKSKSELYEDLRQELKLSPINPEALDLVQIRAELEVIIAKLYGLNQQDWTYLTSTFTYGGKSATKKELDEIIKRSVEVF
ncbi:hypothetical protein QUF50_04990 [Thiotrichales bacterium HSG1]|nr:hypothetical protein [Thiotrichales bacterium HSG1]